MFAYSRSSYFMGFVDAIVETIVSGFNFFDGDDFGPWSTK